MALIKYLNERGASKVIGEIKKRTSTVYNIKGSAKYIDTGLVDDTYTSTGVWKDVDGTWTKVESFKVGDVFNIINAFTTDTDFVEGAGNSIIAGTNLVVVNTGTTVAPVLKFDLLAPTVALDIYQTKLLAAPLTVFSNETPTVYTASAGLPASEAVASATITDLMVAVIGGTSAETGDVYRARVTVNETDPTQNDIIWVKLGNQRTVEGSLSLLAATAPNTPISDAEIEAIFAD